MHHQWTRRGLAGLRWLGACLVAIAASAAPAAAKSAEIGWVGLSRDLRVEGYWGSADYTFSGGSKGSGSQIVVNFEGAFLGKVTSLGNFGGVEFGLNMGYDGAAANEDTGSERPTLGAFAYDFSVGFPITLFHHMSGSKEVLQVGIAPGFGLNHLHVYATYLKAKATAAISDGMAAEVQWQWWPGKTSATQFGENGEGLNAAAVKGTLFLGDYGERAFLLFSEYWWADREVEKPAQGNPAYFDGQNPFNTTTRSEFGAVFRVGAGLAF